MIEVCLGAAEENRLGTSKERETGYDIEEEMRVKKAEKPLQNTPNAIEENLVIPNCTMIAKGELLFAI